MIIKEDAVKIQVYHKPEDKHIPLMVSTQIRATSIHLPEPVADMVPYVASQSTALPPVHNVGSVTSPTTGSPCATLLDTT